MTFVWRSAAALLAVVFAGVVMVVSASPVWAHIGLSDSDPQNVSTVDEPVERIRLTFTGEADPAVERFAIEDPEGKAVPITSIEPEGDGTTLIVTPTHPLAGGRHRVRWAIRSDDAHTMNGTVAFTVTAPAAAVSADETAVGTSPSTIGTAPITDTTGASPTEGAERVAMIARWLVYAALLFCVGGLGYLTWVHRGSAAEGRWLAFLIRRAALLVAVGAILEILAQVVVFDGGSVGAVFSPAAWGDVLGESFGMGTFLRLAGAALVLGFLRIDLDHAFLLDGAIGFDELSARDLALIDEPGGVATKLEPTTAPLVRLRVEASPIAFVGAVLLVASEAFLGHTATTQPRLLVVASDAGHLVAGGLWAAGAVMLAATISRRHRRGLPLDARLLATRFSVVATWSIAGVAFTGLALAWGILGEVDAIWTTTFGKVLLAKVAVVAAIGALGGYNHKVLVPALVEGGEHADHEFRRTVTAEAALFGVVLALTAVLVSSSAI